MIEIINGKVTGTVEVPWDDLPTRYLFQYSGIDFTQYSVDEIRAMTGRGMTSIYNAAYDLGMKLQKSKRIYTPKDADSVVITRIRMGMMAFDETEAELAEALGVGKSAVNKWLNNICNPNEENIAKMAEHFHVPLDYMMGVSNKL